MPALCDVNVLFALVHRRHVFHETAAEWLAGVRAPGEIAVCRVSQLGLLRLLNIPAVLKTEALPVAQVWTVYDKMKSDERFTFVDEPDDLEASMRALMRGRHFSPKLWQDAYLAAFAISADLALVTFDGGFRQFAGLRFVVLSPDM